MCFGVAIDSKSGNNFFGPHWKSLIIRKTIFFPDYVGFLVSYEKNGLQNLILHAKKKNLSKFRQFGKIPLSRRITVANSEYNEVLLYFMHI